MVSTLILQGCTSGLQQVGLESPASIHPLYTFRQDTTKPFVAVGWIHRQGSTLHYSDGSESDNLDPGYQTYNIKWRQPQNVVGMNVAYAFSRREGVGFSGFASQIDHQTRWGGLVSWIIHDGAPQRPHSLQAFFEVQQVRISGKHISGTSLYDYSMLETMKGFGGTFLLWDNRESLFQPLFEMGLSINVIHVSTTSINSDNVLELDLLNQHITMTFGASWAIMNGVELVTCVRWSAIHVGSPYALLPFVFIDGRNSTLWSNRYEPMLQIHTYF